MTMNTRPVILCPVDFSEASAGALRYGCAIAEGCGAELRVLTVEDPLLTEAMDLGSGVLGDPEHTRHELVRFVEERLGESMHGTALQYEVAVGKPATEILRVAQARRCELIVMSAQGRTGMRKLFFGSTTERVLRDTSAPILVTPAADTGPVRLSDVRRQVRRILVPADLSSSSPQQVQVASRLCEALGASLLLTSVVEPVRSIVAARLHLTTLELERKARAEDVLQELLETVPLSFHPEALIASGDPAEEIAKLAHDRDVGLIVIGLHGSPVLGPRMGSVTYRVLCLAQTLVLALPPAGDSAVVPGARLTTPVGVPA
jgi:nucleotide-binding universal stress UspA family protein